MTANKTFRSCDQIDHCCQKKRIMSMTAPSNVHSLENLPSCLCTMNPRSAYACVPVCVRDFRRFCLVGEGRASIATTATGLRLCACANSQDGRRFPRFHRTVFLEEPRKCRKSRPRFPVSRTYANTPFVSRVSRPNPKLL